MMIRNFIVDYIKGDQFDQDFEEYFQLIFLIY